MNNIPQFKLLQFLRNFAKISDYNILPCFFVTKATLYSNSEHYSTALVTSSTDVSVLFVFSQDWSLSHINSLKMARIFSETLPRLPHSLFCCLKITIISGLNQLTWQTVLRVKFGD